MTAKITHYQSFTPRSTNIGGYRYFFNGQEGDNEVFGENSLFAFDYRMHDARLGRFWSVDPLAAKYPWNSTYAFCENTPIWARELEGKEALLFVENEGTGHVFIGVFTEKDIRVYTYGRYLGSYSPSSGQFGPLGDAVLIKYDGAKAQEYIHDHFNKGTSARAYLIPSAKPDKIISYYENLLNNGKPLPEYIEKDGESQKNPYYGYGKCVGIYALLGRSCVTLSTNGLEEGGFDLKKEAFPQISPVGNISPSNVQLMIDIIMSKDASSDSNPRIYDCSKEIKENAERDY